MSDAAHYEIERKYLIMYPDEILLATFPGAIKYEIEQIYLPGTPEITERIRMLRCFEKTEYYHTTKKQISDITRIEEEWQISAEDYRAQKEGGFSLPIIEKVRWRIPQGELIIEVDIYPFWSRVAIAEVELESEEARVELPDFIHVIREVTYEIKYSNFALAMSLRDGGIKDLEKGWFS